MQRFVGQEIALKGGHAVLVEERAVGAAPQVPEIVAGIAALVVGRIILEGTAHHHADVVHQILARIAFASQLHLLHGAVLVEGNGGVEKQVAVAYLVHAAMLEEAADMLLQFVAHAKRVAQLVHQVGLLSRKLERM